MGYDMSRGENGQLRGLRCSMLVVIVIPVLFSLPTMFPAVPPLVKFLPAMPALGVQIAAAIFRLAAVFSVVMDCSVEARFSFFDCALAMSSIVVSVYERRGNEPRKRCHHYGCNCGFSHSSNQDCLLSITFMAGEHPQRMQALPMGRRCVNLSGFYGLVALGDDAVHAVPEMPPRKRHWC